MSQLSADSTHIFEPGIIEYYSDRPDGQDRDQISLASFATNYTIIGKLGTLSNPKLKTFDKWLRKR